MRRIVVTASLVAALLTPIATGVSPAAADVADAGVPETVPAPGAGSVPIDCSRADERIVVTVSSHLDPSCVWTLGFEIPASDVVLDCQGATVRGTSGRGIDIVTPIEVDLSGVTVRNCRVEGFLNNLRVTRTGFRTLAPGVEYVHHLTDVLLEHNDFTDSRGVGVFVDGYVSGVTIRSNRIMRTGSTGIYLETGSRRTRVENNLIHDNGFRENGPMGQIDEFAGLRFRWWGIGREGLAIDGSYENVVIGNDFAGNSHGGVMLYTNCGEFPDSGVWFDRRWPSDDNLIEGNTFTGGLNGVWAGQRMGENTLPMECTKEPYVTGPLRSITLDFAADNTIRGNHFIDVTYAIRVEDDGTVVDGNTFTASSPDHHAVIIGTPDRTTVLERPVARTTLTDNVADITGNPNPYRWVHGYDGLTVLGNTANGAAVGICEGEPPPRLSLIWVIAAAFEPVGAPVTPTPTNLQHPVLGALAPCPPVGLPSLIAGTHTVTEGTDDTIRIPIRLSHASDQTVRVVWDTPPLSATGVGTVGVDYAAGGGILEFEPGTTEHVVEFALFDDATPESLEWAVAWFRDPTNARIGGWWGIGVGFVGDDD